MAPGSNRPTDAARAPRRARARERDPAESAPTDPLGEVRQLVAVRRTALRAVVLAATVALAVSLVATEATAGGAVDRAALLVALAGFGYALVELFRPNGALRRAEVATFAALAVALAGGLAAKLFTTEDPAVHAAGWRDFAAWAPLAYVWATFAFDRRRGAWLSIGFYAVALAILAGHAWGESAVAWRSLAPFYLASWAYVPALYALSWSLERHVQAMALAETAADRAFVDPLTGMPNRTRFMDRLDRSVALAERTGTGFAVLFVDLDGFKGVNDAFGHQAGDAMLRALAARMAGAVRRSDTVARLSGDEFAVLTGESIDAEGVRVLAHKMVAACAGPVEVDNRLLRVSASVGVARFPDHGADAEALIRAADAAMYVAKWGGTGRVQIGPVRKGEPRG